MDYAVGRLEKLAVISKSAVYNFRPAGKIWMEQINDQSAYEINQIDTSTLQINNYIKME